MPCPHRVHADDRGRGVINSPSGAVRLHRQLAPLPFADDPEQLLRLRGIIKSRVSLTVLAEAVDVVMLGTAQVSSSQ